MKNLFLVAVLALTFSACSTTATIKTPLDVAKAQKMLAPGTNTIHGSSLIRQNGGGVVTCAGNPVFLLPVTETSDEWANAIFKSTDHGYHGVGEAGVNFVGADELFSHSKTTNCDALGAFEFDEMADGSFYVYTTITWHAGYMLQGGMLMRKVALSGGRKVSTVLAQ